MDTVTHVSSKEFDRSVAEAQATSEACWQRRLSEPRLFYGERIGPKGIEERGIFYNLAEFLPYRREGWEATREITMLADDAIRLDY